ncbi:MAG: transcription elongation factor GreA [Chloroflexi bacterium]|nr:transcription elongation factor GreA [Chloroflexota bacterium]
MAQPIESPVPTLAEAAAQYGATLSANERSRQQPEVSRFVRWIGPATPISQVAVVDVEGYQEAVERTGADLNLRLVPVRELLAFSRKKGWTTENLGKYLKLKRVSGRKGAGDRAEVRVEAEAVQLTPEGHAELRRELEYLTTVKRNEIARDLYEARIDKDFRENAPFDAAKQHQGEIETRIRQLERTLAAAQIVEQNGEGGRVGLGSIVVLRDIAHQEELTYTLVGTTEANPAAGRISVASPVGRALIDRRPGEEIHVDAPAGTIVYRIEQVKTG